MRAHRACYHRAASRHRVVTWRSARDVSVLNVIGRRQNGRDVDNVAVTVDGRGRGRINGHFGYQAA